MQHVSFIVSGPPVGKERPRVVGRRAFTPKKTKDYEEHIVRCFDLAKMRWTRSGGGTWDTGGQFALTVAVYVPSMRHPDGDNVVKCVSDALNGRAWKDDKQITSASFTINYVEQPPSIEVLISQVRDQETVDKIQASLRAWRNRQRREGNVVEPSSRRPSARRKR